ncbi:hypothetical protein PsorP6_017071 [Peronosclerospora sorghi]|uniref:Uncharacterized protein n=1 Tax=Peronosclerospora sorghi TaxID=230839 RepID=A0ACC0WCV9_9STRA|nr:hypothetical protein PsorP6_017071 [Peronosclerospora sorghi]
MDEVTIDSDDFQVMRNSVDTMQQQIKRGLEDLAEIRALLKEAAAQRELERQKYEARTLAVFTSSKV